MDVGASGKPAFITLQPARITQAQVFVADALAASEHGIHKLLWLQLVAIALAADFKPFHGVPSRVLQTDDIYGAQLLVMRQHFGYAVRRVAMLGELAHQFNRVFQGQFGARAYSKVGGVDGVAHQHHMAVAVEVRPIFAGDTLEIKPGRAAQMAGIGHQLFAL